MEETMWSHLLHGSLPNGKDDVDDVVETIATSAGVKLTDLGSACSADTQA